MNQNKQETQRKFAPTFMALANKNTIYILAVVLVLGGWMGYSSMQRELFPEIVVPYISVSTPHPGNSPSDMENLITRPLEKELKDLTGVKQMSSNSFQDMSMIIIEFDTDVPVEQAKLDVKDKVDKALSELPDDLMDEPIVDDIDFSEFPILNINLSGDYSLLELKYFAETLQDEFEGLREVRQADIRGVEEREVKIHVDPHRLEAYNLTFHDIELAVQMENMTMGAGEILVDGTRRSIRLQADYADMSDISNTIIKEVDGRVIYIKDVAEVIDGFEERSSISLLNKKPVVTLSIVKKSGQNLLDATDKILAIIKEKQQQGSLPEGLVVTITDDQSVYVRDQIQNLENSIIMGMLFVILILYLFLGLRNALFSGLAIPVSMIISMLVLKQIDYTINTMVLFSLVLALGMLVDNAIVVIENVYRMVEKGKSIEEAVKYGTSEIAMPIISSTATTLAAFVPLIFWPGIVGEFMSYLPVTLIVVLSSSLFVALVLNPVFAARFIRKEDVEQKTQSAKGLIIASVLAGGGIVAHILGNMLWGNILIFPLLLILLNRFVLKPLSICFQQRILPALESLYESTLQWALKPRVSTALLIGVSVLFFFSIFFFAMMKPHVVFFPENEPRTIYMTLELPLGADIDQSEALTIEAEKLAYEVLEPYMDIVKSLGITIGSGKGGLFESGRNPNKSLMTITFLDYQYRQGFSTRKIMSELTAAFSDFSGAKVFVEKEENGPPVGKPINIEIAGDDYDRLIKLAEDIKRLIVEDYIPGIEQLEMDLNTSKPELEVKIDREKVGRIGLSTQQVAMTLRTALYGKEISKYKDGEDEYNIMLRLQDAYRSDVASLMNQKIKLEKNGVVSLIPISAVASYEYTSSYEKIIRIDNVRVITLGSNVIEGYNANEINARIRELLDNYDMPVGYTSKMTGEQENQEETSSFLMGALLFALALIAMILITQFNSAIKPLMIIATVALSTIGVFMGLGSFQMDFVIMMSGVGIVSLAGIVVNNGIVLIDYMDLVRKNKKKELLLDEASRLSVEEEAACVILAGKTRLRPVLLTAITTVLGLLPMGIGLNFNFSTLFSELDPQIYFGGDNADFWSPMAWTVIFGLSTSTVLTLLILPVMYYVAVQVRNKMNKMT